jgi:MFS family permease
LPSISTSLHVSGASLAWVVNAYVLTLAGLLLVGGRLADQLGRRRVFLAGLGIFGIASLGCGLATASAVLVAARAVQGIGAALAAPSALALIADIFPAGRERTRVLGVWALIGATGGAFGVLIGGVLTSLLGWRWIFEVNLPLCAAAIALTRRSISADPPSTRQLEIGALRREITAVVLVTIGLTMLILAVMTGPQSGWSSPGTLVTLSASALALVMFAMVERSSSRPLLPVGLLADRVTGSMTVVTVLAAGAGFGMLFLLSLYMRPFRFSGALLKRPQRSAIQFVHTGQRQLVDDADRLRYLVRRQ